MKPHIISPAALSRKSKASTKTTPSIQPQNAMTTPGFNVFSGYPPGLIARGSPRLCFSGDKSANNQHKYVRFGPLLINTWA